LTDGAAATIMAVMGVDAASFEKTGHGTQVERWARREKGE
jgi:hypothetical protein